MRLIDADALTNDIIRRWNTNDDTDFANKEVWKALEEAPTIDAEPVVRCKDCKHRIKWNDSFGCAFWGYYGDEFADGEMFCHKGERKDDE